MAKINAQAFDADCALGFFQTLDQVHLVAIAAAGGVRGHKNFGTDYDGATAWAIEHNKTASVYWTVNRVPDGFHGKPAKDKIVSARFAHVDLDPPHDGSPFDKRAVVETLENLRYPPTIVIDSGNGLQGLWAIEDCHNGPQIERLNQQIRTMFGADSCWNVDRLFRVPGSVNHPNAAKIARGRKPTMASIAMAHTGEVYEMEQLAAFFPEPEMPTEAVQRVAATIGAVDMLTPDDMGLTPFHPVRLAVEKPKGSDRSQQVYHAACAMAREGYTDAQMAGMLLNPANKVSAHLLDQGDPRRACERAIGSARGVEPEPLPIAAVSALVKVSESHLIEHRDDIVTVQPDEQFIIDGLSGPIRLMYETVNAYAPSARPMFSLGAAITLFATAAGRRYQSVSGIMTNMYVVGLIASGSGKDFPLRSVGTVLSYAGYADWVGGRIVSATGIRAALEKQPNLFVPVDELGKLVQAMNNPKGNLRDAVSMLLELYSESQSFTKGGMYANTGDRPTVLIHNPCMSFLGVATPSSFWQGLTSESVTDGFLPRMILLSDNTPDSKARRDLRKAVWPDSLIDAVKAVAAGAEGHITFPMGEGPSVGPRPFVVDYADSAAKDRWWAMKDEEYDYRQSLPEHQHAFANRLAENGTKLALVRAISDNPARPVMRVEDIEWGHAIAKRSVELFLSETSKNLAENDYHRSANRVEEVIRAAGEAGISHSDLSRRTKYIKGRDREDIVTDLKAQGSIVEEKVPTGGRQRIVYRAI